MLYTLLFKKYADVGHYANQVQTFDSYEPDNLAEVARPINFGEVQLHDFHTQYNKINGNAFFTQCDVDWVRFQPTCSGNFVVRTFAIVGRNEANTRLTIFDNSMTQLVQNDDISSGNLFSSLNYNFVSGQTYFVRIENMSPNQTSYYSLQIGGYTMEGPDIVCSTSSYGITNLPQNALVSWAPSPAGIVTINPDIGPSTNATKQNDGDFILKATITSGCSANPIEIEKNLKAGPYPSFILGPYEPLAHTIMGVTCLNEQYYFVASEVLYDPQQSYMWVLFPPPSSSSFPTLHSGSTIYLTFIETGLHTLRVTKTNSCGNISTDMLIDVQLCSGSLRIIASPNPTKNKLTVQLMDPYDNHEQLSLEEVVAMELYQAATGIKKRSWSFKNNQKSFELNVAGLNRGIYILRVSKGKFWHTKQIIIE